MFIRTPCIKNVEDIVDTAVEMCQSLCRALQTDIIRILIMTNLISVPF